MTNLLRKIIALALLACLIAVPVLAQEAPLMTERELSKFIADWPSIVQWLENRGKDFDSAASGQALAAYFAGADFEAFLRGKGWTAERFGYVAGTAFTLTAYVNFERENPDIAKQFDDAIAEVRSNAAMSAEEKADMINGLENAKKSMLNLSSEAKLNEAELKLVRAKYDALMKILESSK